MAPQVSIVASYFVLNKPSHEIIFTHKILGKTPAGVAQ